MSYFHTGIRTIIGAESFHCPVRDGKEWDQLAMVIRLKLFTARGMAWCSSFAESNSYLDCVFAEGSLRCSCSLASVHPSVHVYLQSRRPGIRSSKL